MQTEASFQRNGQGHFSPSASGESARMSASAPERLALTEHELANRWALSVRTVRRWRQTDLGPVFCKFGSRVTYLLREVEAYERRVSKNATFARAYD